MAEIIPSDAVRAIQDGVKTDIISVRDREFITRPVHLPPFEPLPDTLTVHTLSGVAIFCNSFPKDHVAFIHVDSAKDVYVIGELDEQSRKRPCYLHATLFQAKQFRFNQSFKQEEFIIGIQTGFVDNANRQKFLQIAGNVETEGSTRQSDDGVSQRITIRQGTSLEAEAEFKNPVWLAPFRTFPEIDQPESPFIFRVTGDGLLALHETLETEWQLKAIRAIHDYLAEKVKDVQILY